MYLLHTVQLTKPHVISDICSWTEIPGKGRGCGRRMDVLLRVVRGREHKGEGIRVVKGREKALSR